MTKETLERGIQEIAPDLIEDAKYGENAACEPASQAKHADSGGPEVRQIVSSRRPNGLKTVAAIAAALAVVVALSALALHQRPGKRTAGNPAAEGEGTYENTAAVKPGVDGVGFTEAEICAFINSQLGTVTAGIRAEYHLTGEIRICTKGICRETLGEKNVLHRDSLFLPITKDGTIIAALELFRVDGKISCSLAAGGESWEGWNRVFAEHPDEDLVFALAGGVCDVAITPKNEILEIAGSGKEFLAEGGDWYSLLKTDYNVFSAADLKDGIAVQVTERAFRPQSITSSEQSFSATVETNDGKAILVKGAAAKDETNYGLEFWLSVSEETRITKDGETVDVSALKPGSTVCVIFTGEVMETYPMQIAHVQEIQLLSAAPADSGLREDRCELYLRVLKDLWDEDPGLNSGVSQIGVDLSELTDLTEEEKTYVIQTFADSLGLPYLTGTWTELCDRGVIDRERLVWEDGLFFSVKTAHSFQWIYGIPAPSEEAPELMAFDAQKWRSGLGAIMFNRCIAKKNPDGAWAYTVGSSAIA